MPLITIKYDERKIPPEFLEDFVKSLPAVAAQALSCEEGGELKPEDIMIELDSHGPNDTNVKEFQMRIYAHDYPSRRTNLDDIRKTIALHLMNSFQEIFCRGREPSWYVWVFLSQTSYESDTEG